jgi:hypothetical protein
MANTNSSEFLRSLLILCLLSMGTPIFADPFADLASPSEDVRSHAAQIIRDQHLYHPTPRTTWDELSTSLKKDESTQDLVDAMHKKGIAPDITADIFSRPAIYSFQLDDSWRLNCVVSDSQLHRWEIIEEPRTIMVSPPANYSGHWHVYKLDGTPVSLDYEDGHRLGPLTSTR